MTPREAATQTDARRSAPGGPEAALAELRELREQLDALLVKHAVLGLALQEVLRQADLPLARSLGRTLPQRVASLVEAVADEADAAAVRQAAREELRGLLRALWR